MKTQIQHDDKAIILNPDKWPAWPCLPLKRGNNELEDKNLGVLLATRQHDDACKGVGPFRVYHVYLFDLPENQKAWDATPRTEYPDADALLADGWMVD